jgi:hypothetical protein
MDHHHRVLFPVLIGMLVPNAAPEVDDLLAVDKRAAGTAQSAG